MEDVYQTRALYREHEKLDAWLNMLKSRKFFDSTRNPNGRKMTNISDPALSTDQSNKGMDLIDLVVELYRGKWLMAIIVALCLIAAVVYTKMATRYYRAQTVVVPVGDSASSGGVNSIISQFGSIPGLSSGIGGNDSSIGLKNEALAVLDSRSFLTNFIQSRNLLPVLFSDRWNEQSNSWDENTLENPPTVSRGQRYFSRELLKISEDRETGVISIAIIWRDREQAAIWANLLVSELNKQLRERSLESSRNKIDYLNKELTNTSVTGIQQGIYRLLETEMSQIAIANTRVEFAFRVIDPAVAPDADNPSKPRRLLAIAGAITIGLVLSFLIVILRLVIRQHR